MAERYEGDGFMVEASFNERTRSDQVYLYVEDYDGETIERYLSVEDFRATLKALVRLDEQIGAHSA